MFRLLLSVSLSVIVASVVVTGVEPWRGQESGINIASSNKRPTGRHDYRLVHHLSDDSQRGVKKTLFGRIPLRNNLDPTMSDYEKELLNNMLQQPMTSWKRYITNMEVGLTDVYVCVSLCIFMSCLRLVTCGALHPAVMKRPNLCSICFKSFAKPKKQMKFNENLWYACWHTFSFIWNLRVLTRDSISSTTPGWPLLLLSSGKSVWYYLSTAAETSLSSPGWPHLIMAPYMKFFYLTELAFWVSNALYLGFETLRSDFKVMVAHHIATIFLIGASYLLNFWRVGVVVLLLHDIVDVFLYWAKTAHYSVAPKKIVDVLFLLFAVSFFIARLVLYPMYIVVPALDYELFRRATDNIVRWPWTVPGVWLMIFSLLVLQCLHVFWFGLIIKMLITLKKKETVTDRGDIRSDSESDSDTDSKKLNKAVEAAEGEGQSDTLRRRTRQPNT